MDPTAHAIDILIADVLSRAAIQSPPVDVLHLAECLQLTVAYDQRQAGRARHVCLDGNPTIFVRPDERAERLQWAIAHELGEAHAPRIATACGLEPDETSADWREQTANRFASRLLLPEAWFPRDARACDADLPSLKDRYSTASHELIAWRLLDLPEPTVVTILDHARLTRRRANRGRPAPWQACEQAVWQTVHDRGQPRDERSAAWRIQCWPVHEPGWKREIVRVTWEEWE